LSTLIAAVALAASAAGAATEHTTLPSSTVLDLRVVRRDGKPVPLRDVVRDVPTIIAFWATYCPPCQAEVPALNRAAERWRDRGLRVLGVAMDGDDPGRVRDAARTWGIRYDVIRIAPGQDDLTATLFPRGLPLAALVAHDRLIVHDGLLDDAALEKMVPPLLDAGPTSAPSDSR